MAGQIAIARATTVTALVVVGLVGLPGCGDDAEPAAVDTTKLESQALPSYSDETRRAIIDAITTARSENADPDGAGRALGTAFAADISSHDYADDRSVSDRFAAWVEAGSIPADVCRVAATTTANGLEPLVRMDRMSQVQAKQAAEQMTEACDSQSSPTD